MPGRSCYRVDGDRDWLRGGPTRARVIGYLGPEGSEPPELEAQASRKGAASS